MLGGEDVSGEISVSVNIHSFCVHCHPTVLTYFLSIGMYIMGINLYENQQQVKLPNHFCFGKCSSSLQVRMSIIDSII